MSHFTHSGVVALALATLCGTVNVSAMPLTPFRYEDQAQRHCPDDEVVWLDFEVGRYYAKGQKRYGVGWTGSYVCRKEVKTSGFRRSLLERR